MQLTVFIAQQVTNQFGTRSRKASGIGLRVMKIGLSRSSTSEFILSPFGMCPLHQTVLICPVRMRLHGEQNFFSATPWLGFKTAKLRIGYKKENCFQYEQLPDTTIVVSTAASAILSPKRENVLSLLSCLLSSARTSKSRSFS